MELKTTTVRVYDDAFKRKVVNEYLEGKVTIKGLNRKYRITGHVTIARWLVQLGHGKIARARKKIRFVEKPIFAKMGSKDKSVEDLEKEIRDLKRKLEDEQLRSELYRRMIEKTEKELKISIKKKLDSK